MTTEDPLADRITGEPERVERFGSVTVEHYADAVRLVSASDDLGFNTLTVGSEDADALGEAIQRVAEVDS